MNELITFVDNTRLPEKDRAVKLHENILTHANLATEHLFEFYKSLKHMKDTELYKKLGYNAFEEYTEGALGIKQRQAYSYISAIEKLGEDYIAKNATLGVSKLALLASASISEREQLDEKVNIENASVRELQDALKEIQSLKEQISFLEDEKGNSSDTSESEVVANNGMSEEEVKALIVKETDKARSEALQGYAGNIKALETAKADAEKQRKEAESKAKDLEKQKEEAERKAKELEEELELEKQQVKIDEQTAKQLEEERLKREQLEKQLKVSENPVMTEFKFMLKNLQGEFNQIHAFAAQAEESNKMLNALKKVVQTLTDKI